MNPAADLEDISVETLLGQVANEYSGRLARGESPEIEEYVERYPQIAELIREVFPALGLLKDASKSDTDDSAEPVDVSARHSLGDYRIIGELEDVARREQNNFDENQRLERSDSEELQSEESRERRRSGESDCHTHGRNSPRT